MSEPVSRRGRRLRRRIACLAALVSALLLVTACTGIPDSSKPQRLEAVAGNTGAKPSPPPRNATARTIVGDFLNAGAVGDSRHASAREYLTAAASSKWSDDNATIIKANPTIPNPVNGKIVIQATVLGSLSASGVYTSQAVTAGESTFTFDIAQVTAGQYRISGLASGVILTNAQFNGHYSQQVVYFCASSPISSCSYVPDPRWTSIPAYDPAQLSLWLVQQAVGAARPELTDTVANDVFPAQATAALVRTRLGDSSVRVEIPGSSQLSSTARYRMAGVLARTLSVIAQNDTLTITVTDDQRPVVIPGVANSAQFTPNQFPAEESSTGNLYFVDSGSHVRKRSQPDAPDRLVPGPLGAGKGNQVKSVALAARSGGQVAVAATTGRAPLADSRLYVGTLATQPRLVKLAGQISGQLTRPAWAPHRQEVWIGSKNILYRVLVSGSTIRAVAVPNDLPVAARNLQFSSIRFSPDGNQVAVTVRSAPDVSTLYVGAVQWGGAVVLRGLTAVSPPGVFATDADWSGANQLAVIAAPASSLDSAAVYVTSSDGSNWAPYSAGLTGLPGKPENIAASSAAGDIWVESSNQLWQANPESWLPEGLNDSELGYAPVFETS